MSKLYLIEKCVVGVLCTLNLTCIPPAGEIPSAFPTTRVDSIVLERTLCFGTCPAYRLRLNSLGHVHFQSRNPGEQLNFGSDTVAASTYDSLLARAKRIRLYEFPGSIHPRNRSVCPVDGTDHPSVAVQIFADSANSKRLDHYTGCYPDAGDDRLRVRLAQLMAFYAAIDSATGAARWIRPANIR